MRRAQAWIAVSLAALLHACAATREPADSASPADQAEPPVVVEAEPAPEPEPEPELLADIDALCVLPEVMPMDLEQACMDVGAQMDGFMVRSAEGDALARWEEAKGTQVSMMTVMCQKSGMIEVAACQAHCRWDLGDPDVHGTMWRPRELRAPCWRSRVCVQLMMPRPPRKRVASRTRLDGLTANG